MHIQVRALRAGEGRVYLELLARSIRGLASHYYDPEVIAAWLTPTDEDTLRRFELNPQSEVRLLAEVDGQPVGIGAMIVANSELRACYVAPEACRKGVGSALVREIETVAKKYGLTHLHLHGSVNAEPFYAALGYEVVERGEHVLSTGHRMAAVRMRKTLASRD
jgi:putative acetyltransferase